MKLKWPTFIYHKKKNPNRRNHFGRSIDGWDRREYHLSTRWPFLWFLQKTFPDFFYDKYRWIKIRLSRQKWKFIHTHIKRHQYHIIRPSTLEPGYCDTQERILHGVFHELVNFYDNGFDQIKWYYDENEDEKNEIEYFKERSFIADEIKELVHWWKDVYPNRGDIWEEKNPSPPDPEGAEDEFMWMFKNKFKKTPEGNAWREWARLSNDEDNRQEKENETQLIRVMKIRNYLWI